MAPDLLTRLLGDAEGQSPTCPRSEAPTQHRPTSLTTNRYSNLPVDVPRAFRLPGQWIINVIEH